MREFKKTKGTSESNGDEKIVGKKRGPSKS